MTAVAAHQAFELSRRMISLAFLMLRSYALRSYAWNPVPVLRNDTPRHHLLPGAQSRLSRATVELSFHMSFLWLSCDFWLRCGLAPALWRLGVRVVPAWGRRRPVGWRVAARNFAYPRGLSRRVMPVRCLGRELWRTGAQSRSTSWWRWG